MEAEAMMTELIAEIEKQVFNGELPPDADERIVLAVMAAVPVVRNSRQAEQKVFLDELRSGLAAYRAAKNSRWSA